MQSHKITERCILDLETSHSDVETAAGRYLRSVLLQEVPGGRTKTGPRVVFSRIWKLSCSGVIEIQVVLMGFASERLESGHPFLNFQTDIRSASPHPVVLLFVASWFIEGISEPRPYTLDLRFYVLQKYRTVCVKSI